MQSAQGHNPPVATQEAAWDDMDDADTPADELATKGMHDAGHAAGVEHGHPNALRYVQIAVVLSVLTMVEIGVYYLRDLHVYLTAILLVLSTVKFILVVAFYMHLKFDNKLFTYLFVLGLAIGASLITAMLALEWPFFISALTGS